MATDSAIQLRRLATALKVLESLKDGQTVETACANVNISPSTWYLWKKSTWLQEFIDKALGEAKDSGMMQLVGNLPSMVGSACKDAQNQELSARDRSMRFRDILLFAKQFLPHAGELQQPTGDAKSWLAKHGHRFLGPTQVNVQVQGDVNISQQATEDNDIVEGEVVTEDRHSPKQWASEEARAFDKQHGIEDMVFPTVDGETQRELEPEPEATQPAPHSEIGSEELERLHYPYHRENSDDDENERHVEIVFASKGPM